ncbi:MAG: histone deacetylase [Candidatus Baldrarchaeia archaeon]
MVTTGLFFSKIFKGRDWPIIGDKFRNFPEVLKNVLELPNVQLYESPPVDEELLRKVHDFELLEQTKSAWYYEGALRAVGGCVRAAEMVWRGELRNALVFTVAAGHHAGPSSAWGGTYLSSLGPTIRYLREKYGVRRFAILDTDSHHGDGDRAMFIGDKDVLHVCFCSSNAVEDDGTKVDVDVGWKTTDDEYLKLIEEEFVPRVRRFQPQMVFHFLGHDTCEGDYGDRGLSPSFFIELVKVVKRCSEEVCEGRYVILTGGGSRRDVAEYIFPKIVELLAMDD